MPDIKLIVTDLDDTFLDGEYAPDMNVAAIGHARQAGIKVLPCTGRPWIMAESIVRGYDFDKVCVVSNGAAIMDMVTGKALYRNHIPGDTLHRLLGLAESYGVGFDVTCGHMMGMMDSQRHIQRGEMYDIMLDWLSRNDKIRYFESVDGMAAGCGENAELVRFFIRKGEDDTRRLVDELSGIEGIEFARSYRLHVDIMANGVNKGAAIPILARMYGIGEEEIMAVGDQMNDAPMLQAAGLGVAVGNADERLKAVADRVTDTNRNAGFAKAVYEYALKC